MNMKKLTITLILTCSWVVSYAQSNTQLNLNAASLKPSSTSSNVTVSSNITISGATVSSSQTINAIGTNLYSRTPDSSTIITSGATSSSTSALKTSTATSQANNTSTTVTSQNALATTISNTTITTISPTSTPISASTAKLVVVKTSTPTQMLYRPEIPKPEAIANLHKSTLPQLSKTTSILASALASNHGFETVVRLSNKVNLALTSDVSDTDSSTVSIAKLVDTISSPRSSQDTEFALSMLKQ
jgi:hypothetical protein